jgi:hypothetical protein
MTARKAPAMAATLRCGEPRPAPHPDFSPRQTFLHDELDRPYRVQSMGGLTHAVASGFMVNSNPFSLTAWTRCDDAEASLEAVYSSCDAPTCPACAAIEREEQSLKGARA